jgi:two-component system, NtrC family, sensor kinase
VADPDQLQQVFLNLLLNARDAMPGGGELELASFQLGTNVCVSVRDTGHGLDETVRNQIFDPFFTTKPAGRGTGLGLSVCYGIVTAHRGQLSVESKHNGAEFTVTLPAGSERGR